MKIKQAKQIILLKDKFPELINEWDYEKNKNIDINKITAYSREKVWWICSKGHSFNSYIVNRTQKGTKCSICSGHIILKGFNDLGTNYPNLLKEWDFNKNTINPYAIAIYSHNKAWWICPLGHSYQTKIESRTKRNGGCPYCAGKKVLKGFNDFASKYHNLLVEWDYSKNIIKPDEVSQCSGKRVWWKCKYGHSWKSLISNRVNKHTETGCPICNNNSKTSFGEQTIYYYLKENNYNPINRYKYKGKEIDIYLSSLNIGIEFNGLYWHKNRKEKDKEKETFLSSNGIKMFYICEVTNKNYKYKNKIYFDNKHKYNINLEWAINKLFNILNIKADIDIERDKQKIYELSNINKLDNSFANKFPELLSEWDYSKNLFSPESVTPYSSKKVWWKCENGHSWEAIISSRVRNNRIRNCPFCIPKEKQLINNDYKDILSEWDYSKNTIKPNEVTTNSAKKVWWKCTHGHSWKARISARTNKNNKSRCPYCSCNKLYKGINDLLTLHPDICKEWDYSKNTIKPDEITQSSRKKVYWKCMNGHSYINAPYNRIRNHGCPYCNKRKYSHKHKK